MAKHRVTPKYTKDHGQTIQKNDQLITSLEGSLTPVSSNWQEDKIPEQPAPNGQELINNDNFPDFCPYFFFFFFFKVYLFI